MDRWPPLVVVSEGSGGLSWAHVHESLDVCIPQTRGSFSHTTFPMSLVNSQMEQHDQTSCPISDPGPYPKNDNTASTIQL